MADDLRETLQRIIAFAQKEDRPDWITAERVAFQVHPFEQIQCKLESRGGGVWGYSYGADDPPYSDDLMRGRRRHAIERLWEMSE